MPEMREADVIERRGRCERGDVAADVGVLVRPHDHRHGVPADVGVQLDLHVRIARVGRLLLGGDGVDVLGGGRVRDVHPFLARGGDQGLDQVVGAGKTFVRYNTFQRFDPFRSFTDVDIPLCAHVVSSD